MTLLPWYSSAVFYITTLGACSVTGIDVCKLFKEEQEEAIKKLENTI